MKSFSIRIEEAIERFGEYIGSDIACNQSSIRDALNNLINRFIISIRKLIEDYRNNTFVRDHCGEWVFQSYLDYFKDGFELSDSFKCKGNIDFSRFKSDSRSISFSKDSLNLKASRLSLYALFTKLSEKIKSHELAKLVFEKEENGFDPFLIRKLIMYYCLWLRGELSSSGVFTFGGERFITDGANEDYATDKGNGEDKKNGAVKAVMFREAESLCSIDSIRFWEKCKRQVAIKLNENPKCEKKLRIAFIGKLRDPKNGIPALERLVQTEYKDWKIIPSFFSLKKLSAFTVEVEGRDDSSDTLITGDLTDRDFYLNKCSRFDIICLLDAGYLYTDTNKFSDAYGDNPYAAVKSKLDSLEFVSKRDGIEEIGNEPYDGVYTSIIKWIENQFYGKNHSFAFDPRIFYTLSSLGEELGSHSLYLFLSRDRGKALSSTRSYRNLCKGEYFEGRGVIAYDWSNHNELIPEDLERRNAEVLANRFSDNSIAPVRLWKLIKSMGRFFYSNRFIRLFDDNQICEDAEDAYAESFIEYASNTWVYIDYSALKDKKLYFKLKENEDGDNRSGKFSTIAKLFVASLLRIALDARCFDVCASGFCRKILYNTLTTDAIGFEHLLLAQKLWDKTFFTGDMDISYREEIISIKTPEPEAFALYIKHQEDNLALIELIDSINHADYMDDEYLIKLFSSALPKGRDNSDLSIKLVQTSSKMCEKMGYFACKLY